MINLGSAEEGRAFETVIWLVRLILLVQRFAKRLFENSSYCWRSSCRGFSAASEEKMGCVCEMVLSRAVEKKERAPVGHPQMTCSGTDITGFKLERRGMSLNSLPG